MLGVAEDSGIATVCATLAGAMENTQSINIGLHTSDGTGKESQRSSLQIYLFYSSIGWFRLLK